LDCGLEIADCGLKAIVLNPFSNPQFSIRNPKSEIRKSAIRNPQSAILVVPPDSRVAPGGPPLDPEAQAVTPARRHGHEVRVGRGQAAQFHPPDATDHHQAQRLQKTNIGLIATSPSIDIVSTRTLRLRNQVRVAHAICRCS
jgi:hypothetical protein